MIKKAFIKIKLNKVIDLKISGVTMQSSDKDDYQRISLKIPKKLLVEFEEYARSKNYQRRDNAIIDLIKKELDKN